MIGNVTTTKKVISLVLLGSLLAAGAAVYADTAAQNPAGGDRPARTAGPRGDRGAALLTELVEAGVITAAEQTKVTAALEAQRAQQEADRAGGVRPERPAAGEKPASPFDRLAEADAISQELADRIDAYMEKQREACFAEAVKPLIDGGAFKDAAAVKTAQEAVREAMKTRLEALKPDEADRPDKADFQNLTDAEKTALKEKLEAARTEMQAKHEAVLAEVLKQLVDKGTLTQAQADALKAFKGAAGPGGFGHGRGPGMGRGPAAAE